jgi:hydrogenase maturation protease
MEEKRILVAGIGNVFLGDDGFGVEVVRRLAARTLPDCVRVTEFGIRGFDLAFALMNEPEVTIFVDAAPRGGEPGTLYTIEPDLSALTEPDEHEILIDGHGMNPMRVLRTVMEMGGRLHRILLVGCEPAPPGSDDDWNAGLSPRVKSAVDESLKLIESLISELVSADTGNSQSGREP